MGSLSALFGVMSIAYVLSYLLRGLQQRRKLVGIPTVGEDDLLGSLIQPIRSMWNTKQVVEQGYNKYRGGLFKFRAYGKYKVVVTSPTHIEDMRKAPDDVLSSFEAIAEGLEQDYTLGKSTHYDPFHVDVVRGLFTRNIQARFADVRDEIVTGFSELFPPQDDWVAINLNPIMQYIICRASNRFFVGLPLCRDPDYIDLNLKYTIKVVISAQLIALFPGFLKPIAAQIISPLPRAVKRAKKRLGPIIQDRLDQEKKYGTSDWPGKPNDMLTWILEEAGDHPSRRTVDDVILRVLLLNFGAIHTTSMTLNNALDYLSRYPEYIPQLREEIELVIEEHGWTKQAMGRMKKLDSFLKEVQRINPNQILGVERMVLKEFTFSDGTKVSPGANIAVPMLDFQRDETYFPNADKFMGFRFADKRESEKEESIKHGLVTTSTDFFLFGHGRHACPGRFFAVNELKAFVAHVLLTYDIKAEKEGGPGARMIWFGPVAAQDNNVKYLFRKRRVEQ